MMNKCKHAAFCLILSMSCMSISTVYGFDYKSEVVIENLDNPWSIAFISNSDSVSYTHLTLPTRS